MNSSYVAKFREEIEFCEKAKFTGNVVFQVNFKDGNVGNMNIGVNQSVKLSDKNEGGHA